jgi:hypothetical protein
MIPKRKRSPTTRERRQAQASAAMPSVKKLVKQFGRVAVANCLNKIHARDREAARLAALKKQVAEMQRSLR